MAMKIGSGDPPELATLFRLPTLFSMAYFRHWLAFAGAAAASCAAPVRAADLEWPPLAGELSGQLTPLKTPGAPTLDWKLTLGTLAGSGRTMRLAMTGSGFQFATEATWGDPKNGQWRILNGNADLATWLPSLLASSGVDLAGMAIGGNIAVTGEGRIRAGKIVGQVKAILSAGRLDDPALKLHLEGVELTVNFEDVEQRRTAPAQVLTWKKGRYDTFDIGAGRLVFSLNGETFQVEEATMEIFGGEVVLASFSFVMGKPELAVIARLVAIDVTHLTPLMPSVLADARGRVDGSVTLRRTAGGVEIGAGRLALRPGETADLRLTPKPGLISASLPPAVLKYYPGLGKIETGEIPLRAQSLEVAFTPGGDAQGRTATIHIAGGPVDPNLRAPVDLTINVRGPLETLIRFGTNSRLHFGGTP